MASGKSSQKLDPAVAGKRILILEDEAPIARAMQLKLESSGYEADVAKNGEEGLEKVKNGKYNLILLDLVMPVLDGFGFLEALKEEKIQIPVIVSSNLGQDEDFEKAKKLGAKDYFVKSNTPINKVMEHVEGVLKNNSK